MRIQQLMIVAALSGALAVPAAAQSIKKVESSVHHTLQTAGKDVKETAKSTGSATHHALKTAGNKTKTTLGNATGIHKVGGTVGEAAGDVSRSGKQLGRSAKHSLKKSKAEAHAKLTREGKSAKAQVKP
ncbi:MAG TPA: hypothetical protein VI259_25025 [Gemmatimonadaceae bacterium]